MSDYCEEVSLSCFTADKEAEIRMRDNGDVYRNNCAGMYCCYTRDVNWSLEAVVAHQSTSVYTLTSSVPSRQSLACHAQ